MATLRGIALQRGDILLYSGRSLMSWLIRIKTFSPISHVELAVGDDTALASRDGEGVGTYLLREQDLAVILRPLVPLTDFEWDALTRAHAGQRDLPYDWWGLFGFFAPRLGRDGPTKAFCSEHVARLFKLAGRPLFGVAYPSDKVSPGHFLASPLLETVWQETQ